MKASILDLRRRMPEVVRALDRGECVTILYRGKEKGVLSPTSEQSARKVSARSHEAFGMWADRDDLKDVAEHVRALRARRF